MSALIGWYSKEQESLFAGTPDFKVAIYSTPDGREVEVTEARREGSGPLKFEDAVCLGKLTAYLRSREPRRAHK